MAALAFATQPAAMDIVDAMTGDALLRRILVASIRMAGGACHLAVAVAQGKLGLAMVVARILFPTTALVAIGTLVAQIAAMNVLLAMTLNTLAGGFAVLLAYAMARHAARGAVAALQLEIGHIVVKRFRHQKHDVRLAALVFTVTVLAFK